jgi:inosine-uridine nucleoside N-ribohydrolase
MKIYLIVNFFLGFVLATTLFAQDKSKVIIDVDMGQLNDDAVTMFMLLQSQEVDMLGVTVVSGNTWVENGVAYALRQLEIINRTDVPVYAGVGIPLMGNRQAWLEHEERLWGNVEYMGAFARERPSSYLELETEPYRGYPITEPKSEHAVDFIVRSIKENPHEVTLFVLGPAMNVALAIRKNPEIISLVKEVYYMGGAFDVPGNTTPAAEFNWWFCPESIYMALRAPFKKQIIVPNDIAEAVYYTKEQYDRIVSAPNTPIIQMFRDRHGPRFQSNSESLSYVWDAMTAAIFLKPELITQMEERYVDIDINYGPNYGRSMGYDERRRRGFSNPENYPAGTQKASILLDIDREEFWNLYIDLMTRSID